MKVASDKCSVKKVLLVNDVLVKGAGLPLRIIWSTSFFSPELFWLRTLLRELRTLNFITNETLAQLFSCEFCEISKNTFFYRTPAVAASD